MSSAAADEAVRRLEVYRYGGDASALDAVARRVAEVRSNPSRRAEVARELAGVLASAAAPEAKQFACRQLVYVAGAEQVPALAALLGDDELAHYALMALAVVPGRTADDALLKALTGSRGRARLAIMDTLADRRERRVVPHLSAALPSPDAEESDLAAFALARLGGHEALRALRQAFGNASGIRKRALGDALLALAGAARGPDRPATVRQVAALLDAERAGPELRAAVLPLLVEVRAAKALQLVVAALREDGSPRQRVAASLAREMPGSETTRALCRELPTLSPTGKTLLIAALADRGDADATPALIAACRDSHSGVRLAALRALGRAAGALWAVRAVDVLLSSAGSEDTEIRRATRAALLELPAPGVDERLVSAMAKGPPESRVEAIRAVGDRRVTAALPALLEQAASNDPTISGAALRVLRDLGGPEQLQPLLALLMAAPPGERDELLEAVTSVARRGSDEQQRTGALLQALAAIRKPADRAALLTALGQVGGPRALAALRAAAAGSDPETQLAALAALAEWPTAEPMDDLLRLARTDDVKIATIALRGYLRMIGLDEERPPARTLALYREAAGLVHRPDEKRLLLAGLGKIGFLAALEYAATFLKQEAVRPEAEVAVVEAGRWTAGAYREQTRAALEPVARESANEAVRQRARDLLAVIGRFGEYLTAWEVSPAYRREGADYRQLFDIPFPPEESRSMAVFLDRLTPGPSPQTSWRGVTALPPPARFSEPGGASRTSSAPAAWGANSVTPLHEVCGEGPGVRPSGNPQSAAVPWRLMPAGTNPEQPWLLDLLALLGGEQRVAYLRTAVWSDSARDLVLELGSDDGIKAWWNGEVVVANNTARGVAPGQEKVMVALKTGWNHLLLKVTQNVLGWGVVARLANPDGSPVTGLRYDVPSVVEAATATQLPGLAPPAL